MEPEPETSSVGEPSFWVENNLTVPRVPPTLVDQLKHFDSTHVGTLRHPDPESDYFLKPSLDFLRGEVPDHYVLSFWGHGINSYSANFRLAYGDVAVLFQIGFGGYTDINHSRAAWDAAVAGIDAFLSDIITTPSGNPKARERLVGFSDFRIDEESGSGPTVYSRGLGGRWTPEVSFASWEDFQSKYQP